MKGYIGVENIFAEPMDAKEYSDLVGRVIPGEDGYKVKYEGGYTSWSPKKEFEETYEKIFNTSKLPWAGKENIQPHQQRVIEEYKELNNKYCSLANFIKHGGMEQKVENKEEQKRLIKQSLIMYAYLNILHIRILNF